jgi:hypothetical protein
MISVSSRSEREYYHMKVGVMVKLEFFWVMTLCMVHPSSSASSLSYARVDSPLSKGHPRVFVVRSRHLHCIHKDAQPHFKSVVQRQSMWWIYLSMYKMTSSLMHSVLCLVRWSSPLIMCSVLLIICPVPTFCPSVPRLLLKAQTGLDHRHLIP